MKDSNQTPDDAAARVAALHAEAAADYKHAQSSKQKAAARAQLAEARSHAQDSAFRHRS